MTQVLLLAQAQPKLDALGPALMVFMVVFVVIIVLLIASLWATFAKAGEPGWAAIIPIYNMIVMCRVAGKPEWWFLLTLIPLVGIIFMILIYAGIAEKFGYGAGFTVGLILLPFIFFPILGFGSAEHEAQAVGGEAGTITTTITIAAANMAADSEFPNANGGESFAAVPD